MLLPPLASSDTRLLFCCVTFWTSAAAGGPSACRKRFTSTLGCGEREDISLLTSDRLSISLLYPRYRGPVRAQVVRVSTTDYPTPAIPEPRSLLTILSRPRLRNAFPMCCCIIVPRRRIKVRRRSDPTLPRERGFAANPTCSMTPSLTRSSFSFWKR